MPLVSKFSAFDLKKLLNSLLDPGNTMESSSRALCSQSCMLSAPSFLLLPLKRWVCHYKEDIKGSIKSGEWLDIWIQQNIKSLHLPWILVHPSLTTALLVFLGILAGSYGYKYHSRYTVATIFFMFIIFCECGKYAKWDAQPEFRITPRDLKKLRTITELRTPPFPRSIAWKFSFYLPPIYSNSYNASWYNYFVHIKHYLGTYTFQFSLDMCSNRNADGS